MAAPSDEVRESIVNSFDLQETHTIMEDMHSKQEEVKRIINRIRENIRVQGEEHVTEAEVQKGVIFHLLTNKGKERLEGQF